MNTYWLYYGKRIVYALRAISGLPDHVVRSMALVQYNRCPTAHIGEGCDPYEWERMILHSTIKVFDTN